MEYQVIAIKKINQLKMLWITLDEKFGRWIYILVGALALGLAVLLGGCSTMTPSQRQEVSQAFVEAEKTEQALKARLDAASAVLEDPTATEQAKSEARAEIKYTTPFYLTAKTLRENHQKILTEDGEIDANGVASTIAPFAGPFGGIVVAVGAVVAGIQRSQRARKAVADALALAEQKAQDFKSLVAGLEEAREASPILTEAMADQKEAILANLTPEAYQAIKEVKSELQGP